MNNIALSFSGGGFRAAAYSLGCLSYLNKIGLLQNVKHISSTSGGSITNLLYGVYMFEGKSFKDFFEFLDSNLEGDQILKMALEILADKSKWEGRPFKNKNLINAFSLAYEKLLEKKSLDLFSDRSNSPTLEEICVNSTEFTNGISFRFQSQHPEHRNENGLIGNYYVHFQPESKIGTKLLLADILAASSCFPSGFEPIIFPDDFAHSDLKIDEIYKAFSYNSNPFTSTPEDNNVKGVEKKIGLMDGGITDNQAIDSVILSNNRRSVNNKFDLFICCDVSSYLMDGYVSPVYKNSILNGLSIIFLVILIFVFIFIIGLLLPMSIFINQSWTLLNIAIVLITGLFDFVVIYKIISNIYKVISSQNTWLTLLKKYLRYFASLKFGEINRMINLRIRSLVILSSNVFMKQIRRMYYNYIYNNPIFKNIIISNSIYDLSEVKFDKSFYKRYEIISQDNFQTLDPMNSLSDLSKHINFESDPLLPSNEIIEVAEKARNFVTTLWFDKFHSKQNLKNCTIATGQFTTCYNLLKYYKKLNDPSQSQLVDQLEKDYNVFKKNPFEMIKSQKAGIPGC